MHNTLSQAKAQQFGRLLALVIVIASLFVYALPARGERPLIGEGDPFPLPQATATAPVPYDPPRVPRPGEPTSAPTVASTSTATSTPAIAPSATPDDLKPGVAHSMKPENLGLLKYIVKQGDNISDIAIAFGLKPDSIVWANPEIQANPAALRIGQELWIPPLDGAVHTIVSGDTLLEVAGNYGVELDDILDCYYNDIPDVTKLWPGDKVLIPGATSGPSPSQGGSTRSQIRYAARPAEGAATGTGAFVWPVSGRISQGFRAGHPAIDIMGWTGRPIVAADTGFVVQCGWDDSGYGNVIVIDHGASVMTRYAHLDDFSVQAGDTVEQGEQIGLMGSTGRSTGPHLHFEIIIGGYQKNPTSYLP